MNERLKHQCHRDGCDSEATHRALVEIRCPSPGEDRLLKTESTIIVCPKHAREDLVLAYLRSDQNRASITAACLDAGYTEPDFLTLHVAFALLNPGQHAAIRAVPTVMCDRGGCRKAAHWQIVQKFRLMWQRGRGPHQIKLLTNMCVCDEHKNLTRPADFLDPENESIIRASIAKQAKEHLPDLKTMALEFEPIANGKPAAAKAWVGDDGPHAQFKAG